MPETNQQRRQTSAQEPPCTPKEAVCIHTTKIFDSCRDKDCVEDLRVYLTRDSQSALDRATNVKARSAELLHVYIDVEAAPFHRGKYTVDITFYYRILADALIGGVRPTTIYGLSVFTKRVLLFGSELRAKSFSSRTPIASLDKQTILSGCLPTAVVDVLDPMVLSAKICDVCDRSHCDCAPSDLPCAICECFDDELVLDGECKRLYVTLGQFSIVRLERDVQLLIPAYDYCIPQKECVDSAGCDESPCQIFEGIAFPAEAFFPPKEAQAANPGC